MRRRIGLQFLLEQKINRHAQARQRRFQFVTDGADQIGLRIVEQAKFRNVLQNERRSFEFRQLVADGENAWQIVAVTQRNHFGEISRQVVLARGEHTGQGFRQLRRKSLETERHGRGITNLHRPVACDHKHWVGGGGQRGLHRALGAQHLGQRRFPVGAQFTSHRIKCSCQLAQLIAGKFRHGAVEITFAHGDGRRRQGLDWFEQRRGQSPRHQERQQHRAHHRGEQNPLRCGGEFIDPGRRLLRRRPVAARECLDRVEQPSKHNCVTLLVYARPGRPRTQDRLGSRDEFLIGPINRRHEVGARRSSGTVGLPH